MSQFIGEAAGLSPTANEQRYWDFTRGLTQSSVYFSHSIHDSIFPRHWVFLGHFTEEGLTHRNADHLGP